MKSKRSKALEISKEVKEKVWARQRGRSLFAPYLPITVEECCCHYIGRGQGGLGIEENIFGCYQRSWLNEHYWFDGQEKPKGNLTREEMRIVVANHMRMNYRNWNEKDLVYRKYKKLEELKDGTV